MAKKTLADFEIAKHWKPINPDNIQLYSFPTPNGVKVSIALEELGV
ncbi:MAG: glutathione S-transferase, partial [Pseudomonadota bacterium]